MTIKKRLHHPSITPTHLNPHHPDITLTHLNSSRVSAAVLALMYQRVLTNGYYTLGVKETLETRNGWLNCLLICLFMRLANK